MRAYSVEAIAALRAPHERPMIYIAAHLDSGLRRACLASIDLEWPAGTVWEGLAGILEVGTLEDSGDLSAQGFVYTISSLTTAELSTFLLQPLSGRLVEVWFAVLDEAMTPIGEPVQIHRGAISSRVERDDGKTSVVTITTESPMAQAQRPASFRWNDAGQQLMHPGDKYFSHLATTTEKETGWGRGVT